MQLHLRCLSVIVVSVACLTLPPASSAQSTAERPPQPQGQPPPPAAKINPQDLPVSLDRIQQALANTPRLRFDETGRPVFRVEVFGEKPTIEDILGPDWARGPVKHGSMTHQEFLDLVTPKDMQGFAEYSNREGVTLATTSFVLQWTLQKAIQRFNETKDERERAAARQEVIDALNALEQARAKAGIRK